MLSFLSELGVSLTSGKIVGEDGGGCEYEVAAIWIMPTVVEWRGWDEVG